MLNLELTIGAVRKQLCHELFLLDSTKCGAWFLKSLPNLRSRFEGFFVPVLTTNDWDMFRVIEDVQISATPCGLERLTTGWLIHYEGGATQRFCFSATGDLLCHISGYQGSVFVVVDLRPIYHFDNSDLRYDILENIGGRHILLCANRMAKQIPNRYLYFDSSLDVTLLAEWKESYYPYDEKRNSKPYSQLVNRMFVIDMNQENSDLYLRFSFLPQPDSKNYLSMSQQFENLTLECEELATLKPALEPTWSAEATVASLDMRIDLSLSELQQAFFCAVDSLKKLSVNPFLADTSFAACSSSDLQSDTMGIFAGYPWFFHWWTRDEAFSLGAYLHLGQYQEAKKILFRQIEESLPDGRIPNRCPQASLGSADGIGWCALRFFQLISRGKIRKRADLQYLFDFFQTQTQKLEQHFCHDDLIWTAPFETWMDTGTAEDERCGACLEIQCQHQRLSDLLGLLAKKLGLKTQPVNRRSTIKKHFFNGNCLADLIRKDGFVDQTQRPNVFLAAYILPDLLSKPEWQVCFDIALEKTYCEWGGIASIEKNHYLFQPHYTGQNNHSYHRGDAWYWLNNIAALCLWRVNKKRYHDFIWQIIKASTEEILYAGAPSHHAEVSSAAQQTADGCVAQAWSAAAYIELVGGCSITRFCCNLLRNPSSALSS